MKPASSKATSARPVSDPPEVAAWREAAFWSLILACLAAFGVLSALDDAVLLRGLEALTTHTKIAREAKYDQFDVIAEHIRWGLLALPILALVLRWVPLGGGGRKSATTEAQRHREGEESSQEATTRRTGGTARDRGKGLPCPPLVVGVFALQLCLGAGILTGTWTSVAEKFWLPTPMDQDLIRNAILSRAAVPISKRLSKILPPDAKVYIVTDPGESPIFLNYYLYPRRLYGAESNEGYAEQADTAAFWKKRREEGYRWVYLYRPGVDPVGGGQLIELPPEPGAGAKTGQLDNKAGKGKANTPEMKTERTREGAATR